MGSLFARPGKHSDVWGAEICFATSGENMAELAATRAEWKARARKLSLLLPVVMFCWLSMMALLRARPGSWHSRCVEFWEKRQYQQILNLAHNLGELGASDAETLYF